MLLGLRTVIYPVADLTQATVWYAQVLGVQPYFEQPFYVGFAVGGFELGLLPEGVPSVNGTQALWGVADITTEFKRLIQLGAEALEPVTEVGEGIKVAAVLDPFGNRLGIIENSHFQVSAVR
jgi:predicted enzyme related to lactoylglutathione lyase